MKTIDSTIAELDAFEFDARAPIRLAAIAEAIKAVPDGSVLIEPVLRLFERFPSEDFGAPGPLAHVIERYYEKGYEPQLAASLERAPTSLTLWLANRIINANDEKSAQFRDIIRRIAARNDLPLAIVDEARNYLR